MTKTGTAKTGKSPAFVAVKGMQKAVDAIAGRAADHGSGFEDSMGEEMRIAEAEIASLGWFLTEIVLDTANRARAEAIYLRFAYNRLSARHEEIHEYEDGRDRVPGPYKEPAIFAKVRALVTPST